MGMRRLGEAAVDLGDAFVEVGERKRGVAVIVRHGVAGDDDAGPAAGALAHIVDVAFGRQAVAGLKVRRVARVHHAVLQGVGADLQGREEMGKDLGHRATPRWTRTAPGA